MPDALRNSGGSFAKGAVGKEISGWPWAAAIAIDLAYAPPWWVHAVWLPIGALMTIGGLRVGKAALLFQEYRHNAREGRIAK